MIVTDDVWRVLGIAPTEDRRAIRQAYAARLKGVDPERDPAAFVTLRTAFDRAQSQEAMPPAEAPAPATAPPPDGRYGHMMAIAALLHSATPGQQWLDAPEKAAVLAHWQALATDPTLAEIGFFAEFEHWASRLIVETSPLSAPLVMPAVALFDWTAMDGDVAQDAHAAEISWRYRMLRFLEASRAPDHPHHPAWTELATRAYPGSRRGRVDPRVVYDVLTTLRQVDPELEAGLDPLRVELWKHNSAAPGSELSEAIRHRQRMRLILWVFGILTLCGLAAELVVRVLR